MASSFPYRLLIIFALLGLLLSACGEQAQNLPYVTTAVPGGAPEFLNPTETTADASSDAYPGPTTATPESNDAYPGPAGGAATAVTPSFSEDGRSQTALKSYTLAEASALKDYDPSAKLFAIVPSTIMMRNIGNPPVPPGWFYKFKIPGQRREYIVQVADEKVTGSTLAEPIEDLKPAELEIDVSILKVDSDQVFEKFQTYASQHGIATEGIIYDLELVNLQGGRGPTWSVVEPATGKWLYSISAISGEEVPNPRA